MHQPMRLAGVATCLSILATSNALGGTVQDRLDHNRKAVLEFYELVINKKDFAAAEKYIGPRYIQHNPSAADGKEGLKKFVDYLRTSLPQYHSDIKRSIAEGDYVVLHVYNKPAPESRGQAVVDIFRLKNGKVVEHWDVVQPIPDKPANDNTMF
jgi:predicted SnoaL-like aldol condensation-catalyzing enzyme